VGGVSNRFDEKRPTLLRAVEEQHPLRVRMGIAWIPLHGQLPAVTVRAADLVTGRQRALFEQGLRLLGGCHRTPPGRTLGPVLKILTGGTGHARRVAHDAVLHVVHGSNRRWPVDQHQRFPPPRPASARIARTGGQRGESAHSNERGRRVGGAGQMSRAGDRDAWPGLIGPRHPC
jgi:hypothetical protein